MVKRFLNKIRRQILGKPKVASPVAAEKSPSSKRRRRSPEVARAAEAPPAPASEATWSLERFDVKPEAGKTRFHDLELPLPIMQGIDELGFQYCTPIQADVLKPVTAGRDVAGRAQTGTGKTAAFLIAIFTRYLNNPGPVRAKGAPRALVIAPTRELVIQIIKDAQSLGKHCKLRYLAIYGGMDFDRQQREIEKGQVDLIAATPGRLLDFCRRGIIDLKLVDALVIDEADRMLDMGFIPDVRQIIRRLPPKDKRQTMLFSATLTQDVMRLASQWMKDPIVAEVEPDQVAVDTVDQVVFLVTTKEKFTVLYNLLRKDEAKRVLIFGNRRDQTQGLADALEDHGIPCGLLSGAVAQNRRIKILEDFREGRVRYLVATDVAGRGIHVDSITHVVNYDFPYEADDYVHRIGRTGRAGAAGIAISFACEDESFIIPEIEAYIGKPLKCMQPSEDLLVAPPPAKRRERRRSNDEGPRRSGGAGRGASRGGAPRGGGSRGGGRRGGSGAGRRPSSGSSRPR